MLKAIYKKLNNEGKVLLVVGLVVFLFAIYRQQIIFPFLLSVAGAFAAAFFAAFMFALFSGIYYFFEDLFHKHRSNK